MKVQVVICFGWALALAAIGSQATYAAGGRPSQGTLDAMGLGGMTVMSDDEARVVRGFGYKGGHGGSSAAVFGNSFATINVPGFGSAHSENGYAAEGKKFAKGNNYSEAGVKIEISGGGHKGGGKPSGGYGKPSGNRWGGKMGGGGYGGGKPPGHGGGGGHGGGKPVSISVKVFAGGSSSAWAK